MQYPQRGQLVYVAGRPKVIESFMQRAGREIVFLRDHGNDKVSAVPAFTNAYNWSEEHRGWVQNRRDALQRDDDDSTPLRANIVLGPGYTDDLLARLKAHNIHQSHLADVMGIPRSQMSRWVRTGIVPRMENVEKIERAFAALVAMPRASRRTGAADGRIAAQ